jgi:hypothetical protein
MAVGDPDVVIGPGVCTGAGMPAGVAVCQFPEAEGRHPKGQGPKVCPGPGLCPASANCPNCSALAAASGRSGPAYVVPAEGQLGAPSSPDDMDQGNTSGANQEQQSPGQSKGHGQKGGHHLLGADEEGPNSPRQRSFEDQKILQEMRSLILIDLEKIREEMKVIF